MNGCTPVRHWGGALSLLSHGLNGSGFGLSDSGLGLNDSGIGLSDSGFGLDDSGLGPDGSGFGLNASGLGPNDSGFGLDGSGLGPNDSGLGPDDRGPTTIGPQAGRKGCAYMTGVLSISPHKAGRTLCEEIPTDVKGCSRMSRNVKRPGGGGSRPQRGRPASNRRSRSLS
jgi:hypothetical protein